MPTPQEIKDRLAEINPQAVLLDDLDDALVSIASRFGMEPVAAYDYQKCIEHFQGEGMTHEAAIEWMDFNVTGAWVGEGTPVFINGEW